MEMPRWVVRGFGNSPVWGAPVLVLPKTVGLGHILHPSGPKCEAWPALLLGLKYYFCMMEENVDKTKLFLKKALLLIVVYIYICVCMCVYL